MRIFPSSPVRLLIACAATLLLTGVSPILWAQGDPPPLLSVRVVHVKPDKVDEWEGLQKELSAALAKAGESRSIWQVARGDLDTYHIVSPLQKFADLDNPPAPPMEPGAWSQWQKRASQCVADRQFMILRTSPDSSIPLKEGRKRNLLLLTMRQHAPGRGPEYGAARTKELLPALRKAGVDGITTAQVVAGGNSRTWVTAEYLDKWSDLDGPGPLTKALGENAGKLAAKLGSMVVDVERIVLRFREDLSASVSR